MFSQFWPKNLDTSLEARGEGYAAIEGREPGDLCDETHLLMFETK